MAQKDTISRLRSFIIQEAHSCSMDMGCITPEYVYRMWGGSVSINEIEHALEILKSETYAEQGADQLLCDVREGGLSGG